MTPIQKLEIRAGEIRKRLAEIGGMENLDDETRSEFEKLKVEYADTDSRRGGLDDIRGCPENARRDQEQRRSGIPLVSASV